MNRPKSNFDYRINDRIIEIADLDEGGMSVTNNIENVVEYIRTAENINLKDGYLIVYMDSMGRWDGWDHDKQTFIALGTDTPEEAIKLYRNKLGRHSINIIVSGVAGSGKSNVGLFIMKSLKDIGAHVSMDDPDVSQKMLDNKNFDHLRRIPLRVRIDTVQTKLSEADSHDSHNFMLMSDIQKEKYWSDKIKAYKGINDQKMLISRGSTISHPVRGNGMITYIHNERLVEAVFVMDPQTLVQTDTDLLSFVN